jgi:predicted SprT family Zn-dependent metalloprotease
MFFGKLARWIGANSSSVASFRESFAMIGAAFLVSIVIRINSQALYQTQKFFIASVIPAK